MSEKSPRYNSYHKDISIFTMDEIEAILFHYLNGNQEDVYAVKKLIELFQMYAILKKGNQHEVVISPREVFENILFENQQSTSEQSLTEEY